jgi:hypothetical protein
MTRQELINAIVETVSTRSRSDLQKSLTQAAKAHVKNKTPGSMKIHVRDALKQKQGVEALRRLKDYDYRTGIVPQVLKNSQESRVGVKMGNRRPAARHRSMTRESWKTKNHEIRLKKRAKSHAEHQARARFYDPRGDHSAAIQKAHYPSKFKS